MNKYIVPLKKKFSASGDPVIAAGQSAYMKNQFPFFGIKTDLRREITKAHFREHGLLEEDELHAVVHELWQLPMREYQYAALELIHFHRKKFTENTITCIEECITHKSWWDTVDALNTLCAGIYFQQFPEQMKKVTGRWNRSDNIWLKRSSLLFQLKYKTATDTVLLEKYIKHLSASKEFFIQKAIGWILREYAKTNPAWVRDFVRENTLAPLSRREAMKHLD